ncbi:energy transducer TonB [uncultured Pseudoteredinibacter sp.]|uniref:energy transducer TonB n=1 Tax=uncultured Pseudoteredinibacter sp. TaxID=1641701 RepID=UPI002624B9DB|nr:energy transducer TonB [uncultured Pseudoteredinibacter sp.]
MRHIVLSSLTLSTLFALFTPLQTSAQEIASYRLDKAEIIEQAQPRYPKLELGRGLEGWVVYSVIVDEKGNVIEPILIDSSGRRNFEKNGKRAIKRMKYKPAMLNGEPIQSSDNKVRIEFNILSKTLRAHKAFIDRYREIRSEIMEGKLNNTLQSIENLQPQARNRYEMAWLDLLKSSYYQKMDNKIEYLKALKRAVGYGNRNLPADVFAGGLISLYNAQISNSLIADAIETADRAKEFLEEMPRLSSIQDHRASLEAALASHPLLSTKGLIKDAETPWRHKLYRKTIAIEANSGKLNKVEFRCANKIRSFEIKQEYSSYKIPSSWEGCTAFVYGENGSHLTFLEQS